MRIIIAGMGDVGYQLARELSYESHDIIAIDKDNKRLSYTDSMTDILTINGSATSVEILKSANVDKADLFVAVTSLEEVNVTSAILAKKLGAKKSIARIANAEYLEQETSTNFTDLGIDFMIYPEELAAREVVNLIHRSSATDVLEFEEGKLSVLGMRLDKNAPVIRKTLRDVAEEFSNVSFRIVAVQRNFRTIIPKGNDRFLPNDQVFIITKPDGHERILELSGKENVNFENVMILGGGKIGRRVAGQLENEMKVKLIESDNEKSVELAGVLTNTLVIRGDGRDIDLLAQEGIIDVDAYVALTEDAETNVISCLMAKHLGVKKTIALVDKVEYIPLTQTIGLDSLINKKLIAANNISRFIRKGNIVALASLEGIDADVLEYIADQNSSITKKPIKDLDFPKEAIVGGIVRGEESFIAMGDTQVSPGDKVVVFSLPGGMKKIEKLFK
ncbi:MAG: Trk system potassium transporter TrkA [Ignavibacteria bacterium]|nr:Trk system potassium transporter TrkA [Ignavibacteria bacterium]MBT8383206.1 Trk system potassium transporter TrkA [Ignavibacteria bacterium]MBT8392796.1 Trk system potassium transporter TrkA [Ignavibacteria bacterium]NNJ54357.1 Trk system potassium transporter TrkA [Ignavibacteriaceae bacterium]NNL20526.1 Trk system potassium transporter TrkA [Ignavibacteriaceae bacterium]